MQSKSNRNNINVKNVIMVLMIFMIIYRNATSWRNLLEARFPPLGSRVRVSITPSGFVVEETGSG